LLTRHLWFWRTQEKKLSGKHPSQHGLQTQASQRKGEGSLMNSAALISYNDQNHRQSLQDSALVQILGSLTRICIMVPTQEILNPQKEEMLMGYPGSDDESFEPFLLDVKREKTLTNI